MRVLFYKCILESCRSELSLEVTFLEGGLSVKAYVHQADVW